MRGPRQLPLDERGWLIPRPGTLARRVYEIMVAGTASPTAIAHAVDARPSTVGVMIYRIRHPEKRRRATSSATERTAHERQNRIPAA